MRKIILAGLVSGLIAANACAQNSMDDVQVKVTHVSGNIYMLFGSGGNIGLSVGEDGTLMIDDEFLPLAPKIQAAIDSLGGSAPKFLLNTHWHGDHTGGNPHFGQQATIIAQDHVRDRLMKDQSRNGETIAAPPEVGWPVITFDDSLSVHFNGAEIKAIHFPPSHTDGDVAIRFTGSNVLHTGDLFFNGRFPFVDLSSGGNALGMRESVKKLLSEIPDDIKIIPGHGDLATKADFERYYEMLVSTIDLIKSQVDAGKSADEIVAVGLPDKWDSWSWRLVSEESWIRTVIESLKQ